MEKIIEKKIYKNNQKEVYCPYCKTEKDNRITKLLPITSSSFFSRRMDLIKIYQCFECKNEFEEKELNRLKWHLQQNIIYEILEEKFNIKRKILEEKFNDGLINDKDYEDQIIILEKETEIKKISESLKPF